MPKKIMPKIIICLIIIIGYQIFTSDFKVYANNYPIITNEQLEEFTNKNAFYHNDIEYSIRNYAESMECNTKYHDNTCNLYKSTSDFNYTRIETLNKWAWLTDIYADDPIVNIIPKQLFQNVGDYSYIGEKYGFYVSTFNNGSGNYNTTSIVFVFDIQTIIHKDEASIDNIVTPLFQADYVCLNSDDNNTIRHFNAYSLSYRGEDRYTDFPNNFNSNFYYNIPTNSSFVIPTVAATSKLSGGSPTFEYRTKLNQYSLKNISFQGRLLNENQLNQADKDNGYDKNEDKGMFFIESFYNYQGKVNSYAKPEDALSETADFFVGYIPYFGNFVSALETFGTITNLVEPTLEPVNSSTGNVTHTFYTTYSAGRYGQRTLYNQLVKDHIISLSSNEVIFTAVDYNNIDSRNYAQAKLRYSFSIADSEQEWKTRFIRNISLEVIDTRTQENKCYLEESSSYIYFENEPKEIVMSDLGIDKRGYTIKNGNDTFVFIPTYSGKYTFLCPGSTIKLSRGSESNSINGENSLTSTLIEGEEYKFNVSIDNFKYLNNFFVNLSVNEYINSNEIDLRESLSGSNLDISNIMDLPIKRNIIIKYSSDNIDIFDFKIELYNILDQLIISPGLELRDSNFNLLNSDQSNFTNIVSNNNYYYIIIQLPDSCKNAQLNITSDYTFITLDPITHSYNTSFEIVHGDNLIKLEIPSSGQYSFKMSYMNIENSSFTYVIYKKTTDNIVTLFYYENSQINEYRTHWLYKGDIIYVGYIDSSINNNYFEFNVFEDPTQSFNPTSLNNLTNCSISNGLSNYYAFTTSNIETIKIEIVGFIYENLNFGYEYKSIKTEFKLYDLNNKLISYSIGNNYDYKAKIIKELQPNTTYFLIVNFVDYSSGNFKLLISDCETGFQVNSYNIPKSYMDGYTMEPATFYVFSSFVNPYNFDPINRRITFEKIECSWSITDPLTLPEYYVTMYLGQNRYNLDFFCFDPVLDYRSSLPNTWSFTSTLNNVSIQLSQSDWDTYVTYGPIV